MAFRFSLMALLCACSTSVPSADSRHAVGMTADEEARLGSCEVSTTLAFVNDTATSAEVLRAQGVHSRAASNIADARLGTDGQPGTADDVEFASLVEIDAVSYVGPVAMEQLLAVGTARCADDAEPVTVASCPVDETLALLNAPSTTVETLRAIDLHSRAASELVSHRDGSDGVVGTDDDALFASMDEVDAVPQVGPVAMHTLRAYGESQCGQADTVFSPQDYDASHLARLEQLIDQSDVSIDVAMYSFRDSMLLDALQRAVDRGVTVRFLFESAADHRNDPAGTRSAALEDMGIEVRWVNKIQHHKFALFDGARTDLSAAATGTLASGSGNWSYGAATRFDENMVVVTGDERLMLLFQQEFNLLWDNSRPVVWNEDIAPIDSVGITPADIAAASGSDAVFTSANFRTYDSSRYGPTFAKDGNDGAVRDALVELIASAQDSVWIASGHLRSRQITDAILAKAEQGVDVRVYLDGQEYTSAGYFSYQVAEYEGCVAAARTDGQLASCQDDGLHFGYALHQAGIDVRYKYYAYRWDYHYADQMHHKYLVVDEQVVATGSYNFSNNAEFDTFENVAILQADRYPAVVAGFVDNFDTIWTTGDALYDARLAQVESGQGTIPLVFDAMALGWDDVTRLKSAIRAACPAVDSQAYREDPDAHRVCPR